VPSDALLLAGLALYYTGRFDECLPLMERALEAALQSGVRAQIGVVRTNIALAHIARDDYEAAGQALAAAEKDLSDVPARRHLAFAILAAGDAALAAGDLDAADAAFGRASTLTSGDENEPYTRAVINGRRALLANRRNDHQAALEAASAGFSGVRTDALALAVLAIGAAGAIATERPREAAAVMGSLRALLASGGLVPAPMFEREFERVDDAVRKRIGEREMAHAAAAGQLQDLGRAVAAACAISDEAAVPAGAAPRLSPRERQILASIARGATNRQIGSEHGISHRTVERHVSSIFQKLGVRSRSEAAAWKAGARKTPI
jgi:DNA-binding NarL/FixJ family response regulator